MEAIETNLFDIISRAIEYAREVNSPWINLELLATRVNIPLDVLSEMIYEWSGTSAENFFMFASTAYAKSRVTITPDTLFSNRTLSEPRRTDQQDTVTIQPMLKNEYLAGENSLLIKFSHHHTAFGNVIVASTTVGICYIAFDDDLSNAEATLRQYYPGGTYSMGLEPIHLKALEFFNKRGGEPTSIKLHVKCTEFQLNVWNELLKIPAGELSTYNNIAINLGNAKSARAVGTAIGDNPVAYLIPCHRVVQSNGTIGGYRWGIHRKIAIIAREAATVRFNFGA